MFNFNNFRQKSPQQRFLFIFGLIILLFYFALGVLFIFWKSIPFDIKPTYRILFGVLLIAYAILRFYRLNRPNDT
jgi:cell division septal protein FtsQ